MYIRKMSNLIKEASPCKRTSLSAIEDESDSDIESDYDTERMVENLHELKDAYN